MGDISQEIRQMKFVSKKLELPIFLVSRNRIKRNYYNPMRSYINRKSVSYLRNCNQENPMEMASTDRWKHIVGYDYTPQSPCPTPRATKFIRGTEIPDWKHAPNRYGMIKEPFEARKGNFGAHWGKESHTKHAHNFSKKFYEIDVKFEHCSKKKGLFLGNARTRRASLRCMITDFQTCYRNPKDPGPADYFPKNYTIVHNAHPLVKSKRPNPHIFLKQSCVPAKLNSIHPLHRSFEPGPGRYDIRFPNVCPCTWRLVYKPDLQLLIDREKRQKFRRQPYTVIRARNYCSPEWSHIAGRGFRRLFRISRKERRLALKPILKERKEVKESKEAKEALKGEVKLYADARYISLINDPHRPKISFRVGEAAKHTTPITIIFHCMQKHSVKHRLGINKNVAFGSGVERFKSIKKRPKPFTVADLEKIKNSLPPHLQLKDSPVTKKPISLIKPMYEKVPAHMKPHYDLQLRKRLFKFLPLPTPKVLIREEDVQISKPISYYDKALDVTRYLKSGLSPKLADIAMNI